MARSTIEAVSMELLQRTKKHQEPAESGYQEVLDTVRVRAPRQARIVDQPRNSRVLNTCPSVSIDIPNANGANVGVDMSCVAAGYYEPAPPAGIL